MAAGCRVCGRTKRSKVSRGVNQFTRSKLKNSDSRARIARTGSKERGKTQNLGLAFFLLPVFTSGPFRPPPRQRLYGIRVRERPGAAVWHPSVRYYDLLDADGSPVAGFYLDPYSRNEKRSGAWMDECVIAKSPASGHALPVAQLVCNFTAPVGAAPALLTHDEVTTLFHEFGHGLHHMLTRVAYPSIAGINGVSWDAVELPSQFMENFVWRTEVLPLISAHVDSGEPLPADVLGRLLGTRTFNAALDTLRQIELATFDFELHANYDPADAARGSPKPSTAVRRRVAVTPIAPFNRMPANFAHILRAATRRATTATSGPKCWPPTPSRPSKRRACSTAPPPAVFATRSWRAAAVSTPWTRSCVPRTPARRAAAAQADRDSRLNSARVPAGAHWRLGAKRACLAATAYVSDQLILGVYAEQNQQGQRLRRCIREPASRRSAAAATIPRCAPATASPVGSRAAFWCPASRRRPASRSSRMN